MLLPNVDIHSIFRIVFLPPYLWVSWHRTDWQTLHLFVHWVDVFVFIGSPHEVNTVAHDGAHRNKFRAQRECREVIHSSLKSVQAFIVGVLEILHSCICLYFIGTTLPVHVKDICFCLVRRHDSAYKANWAELICKTLFIPSRQFF
jgi:hypothetical protein